MSALEVYVHAAGYEIGTGRLVPSAAAVLGLMSVVIGGLRRTRKGGALALALGFAAASVGGLHAANAAGGLGTGNGLAGAVVAVVLGLIGMVAGGLALARTRRRLRSG
jgi:hypothetical protein